MKSPASTALTGWAFKPDEKEARARLATRYAEIKQHRDSLNLQRESRYECNVHKGTVPEGVTLSDEDIALLCDDGNCCFGAVVKSNPYGFVCTIWTD